MCGCERLVRDGGVGQRSESRGKHCHVGRWDWQPGKWFFFMQLACGLVLDLREKNLGNRIKRCAFYIQDNQVKHMAVDMGPMKDTSAEALFSKI